MEVSSSCNLQYDDETRALEILLDTFGSDHLKEIAAAFCKAGQNVEVAADILIRSGCSSSAAAGHISNEKQTAVDLSKKSSENISHTVADRNSKVFKPKKHSVSAGTISTVIGKGYSKPTTVLNGLSQSTKPIKVNLHEFRMNESQSDDVSTTGKDSINNDVEEFLFKMLGEGFNLGMDVIRNVLGSCGYDANKSIEKLIDMSASTLKRCDDIVGGFPEKAAGEDSKQKNSLWEEKSERTDYSTRNGVNLSREVLTSLFHTPDIHEPRRRSPIVRAVKPARSFGKVVTEPYEDRVLTNVTDKVELESDMIDDLEEENTYQILRRNAKEHWVTMKEYYKAAVEAFAKGEQTLADEFLREGQYFNNKAREADERSSEKIFECSVVENVDDVLLDLHDCNAREAIRLLKVHLTSFSGIQNVKVILDIDGVDINKVSKKRREHVLKVLEKESIKWTEDGGSITVQLDEVDSEALSFAKKAEED